MNCGTAVLVAGTGRADGVESEMGDEECITG